MNIYLDFEATQFKENIIAIGATCAMGSFDCLVQPPKGDKVTKFITELTGITPEMATNALTVEEAFYDLYMWLNEMGLEGGSPMFYHVYGNMDKVFLSKAAKLITNPYLKDFVENLSASVIDDSIKVCRFFHAKSVGVYKALKYFIPDLSEQDHDPLNDAIALERLITQIDAAGELEKCPFALPPQPKKIPQKSGLRIVTKSVCRSGEKRKIPNFNSFEEALEWVVKSIRKQHPDAQRKSIKKKLKRAITNQGNYLGCQWIVE